VGRSHAYNRISRLKIRIMLPLNAVKQHHLYCSGNILNIHQRLVEQVYFNKQSKTTSQLRNYQKFLIKTPNYCTAKHILPALGGPSPLSPGAVGHGVSLITTNSLPLHSSMTASGSLPTDARSSLKQGPFSSSCNTFGFCTFESQELNHCKIGK